MARPLRIEYPGAFYHVTSRGNEQKAIFKSQRDREKFLGYLESASTRYGAVIHCYCLMGNHYHLLLETPEGNLSQIMRHINGAYTTYFNVKRRRAGHLLQGRYKAILVEADAYALELSRYLHLNPVRAAMVSRPEAYPWSSYRVYVGDQPSPEWLQKNFILSCLAERGENKKERYRAFVADRLGHDYPSPLKQVIAATILGSESFVSTVQKKYLSCKVVEDIPALKVLKTRPSPPEIVATVNQTFPAEPKLARKVAVYLCHQHSGEKLKEIGGRFNLGESGVSQLCRRFSVELEMDRQLKRKLDDLKMSLGLSDVKI